MSTNTPPTRQIEATALAAHAADALAGTPAELEGVDHAADGTPYIEYTHTTTDPETLENVVSSIAGSFTARVGILTPTPERVDVIGYSPVDDDSVALEYHIRREWALDAVDPDGRPAEEILAKIAENAEEWLAGGVEVDHGV